MDEVDRILVGGLIVCLVVLILIQGYHLRLKILHDRRRVKLHEEMSLLADIDD